MRINKYLALSSGLSRRSADHAIESGRVNINNRDAKLGDQVGVSDQVYLDGKALSLPISKIVVMFNKPPGYVTSRRGQGAATIYDLLPTLYHNLKPAGRLDKDSSGLLILTNDGELAQQLTHPRYGKNKIYHVKLDKPLGSLHHQYINNNGIRLEDGNSKLGLSKLDNEGEVWEVTMREGRNRQIRRTFSALGYKVTSLERLVFGPYKLNGLEEGKFKVL